MKWLFGLAFSIVAGFFAAAAASMGDTGAKNMEEAIAAFLTWPRSDIVVATFLFSVVVFGFVAIILKSFELYKPGDAIYILCRAAILGPLIIFLIAGIVAVIAGV